MRRTLRELCAWRSQNNINNSYLTALFERYYYFNTCILLHLEPGF